MSYQGIHNYRNEAAPIVAEYNRRKRLSKLGFTFSGDRLDVFTAECFCLISEEIDKLSDAKMKAVSAKKPGRR
jgi:hypothetical protein